MTLKKVMIGIGVIIVSIFMIGYCSPEHQRFLEFDRQREAWHRRCDVYINKIVATPEARACKVELDAMTAYAQRQGWHQ